MLAAGACVLAGGGLGTAGDVIRLGGTAADEATGDSDTELVRWGYGGYRGGYHGGYRGGYYGGYRGGYYSGYRGGYYGYGGYRGYYRPYYGGYGGYRNYYGGYYRPYYGGYYGGGYISYPSYYYPSYYSYPAYYAPCASTTTVMPYAATYSATAPLQTITQPRVLSPQPAVPQGDGQTYPYDGGPQNLVPQPADVNPTTGPRRTVPRDGLLIGLSQETTGGTSQNLNARLFRLSDSRPADSTPPATRYSYRAYGEEPLPPVTRTPARR